MKGRVTYQKIQRLANETIKFSDCAPIHRCFRERGYSMKYEPALEEGILNRRFQRFLADVTTHLGVAMTIHCPNTGAMLGCSEPGSRVWYSTSSNPRRKYPHSLEIVCNREHHLIGVNSALANTLVEESLASGGIAELEGYRRWKREVPIPDAPPGHSGRFDFALYQEREMTCFVEVKSVTLALGEGLGAFPDAPSVRAQKHVQALLRLACKGNRCVLLFCVQHTGVDRVTVADEVDPVYAKAVRTARAGGVEVLAYGTEISPLGISLTRPLPVLL